MGKGKEGKRAHFAIVSRRRRGIARRIGDAGAGFCFGPWRRV